MTQSQSEQQNLEKTGVSSALLIKTFCRSPETTTTLSKGKSSMSHRVTDFVASMNNFLQEIESITLSDFEESALSRLANSFTTVIQNKASTREQLKRTQATLNDLWRMENSSGSGA